MSVFIARQPILDARKETVGYELLWRSGWDNIAATPDLDEASGVVLHHSLLEFGLGNLVGTRKAFINITRPVLLKELYGLLPSASVVLELHESVRPDPEVTAACERAKAQGYTLALDDFEFRADSEPLLRLADIVKVDFLATDVEERRALVDRLSLFPLRLLAEKVETPDTFEEARRFGYHYFQGFFFARPEVVSRAEIPQLRLSFLRFLQEVNRPEIDFVELEKVILREVSLAVKLLRYLNSAALGFRVEVTSIRQGLVYLGERQMRRWASVVALAGLSESPPQELIVTGLIRAHFAELLAPHAGLAGSEQSLFLVGMLSVVDALLGRPLEEILPEMSLSAEMKEALLGPVNRAGRLLALVIAHERGDWARLSGLASDLGLEGEHVARASRKAVEWASEVVALMAGAAGPGARGR